MNVEAIQSTPLFTETNAADCLAELGALFDVEGEASKQGGGGKQINWRWPNNTAISLREMTELMTILYHIVLWGLDVSLSTDRRKMRGFRYYAYIGTDFAYANTPQAAIWLALIKSGYKPNARIRSNNLGEISRVAL